MIIRNQVLSVVLQLKYRAFKKQAAITKLMHLMCHQKWEQVSSQ